MATTKFNGKSFRIWLETSPSVWTLIKGVTTESGTYSSEAVETTDKDDMPWKSLADFGVKFTDLELSGFVRSDSPALDFLQGKALDGTACNAKVTTGDGSTLFTAAYFVTSFSRTGEKGGAEQMSASLTKAENYSLAPSITSSLTANGQVGVAFSYTIVATQSPTSYAATGLPAGLSINTGTGAITGTPTTAATSNITISATNAFGTDTKTLVLTVIVAAPSITSSLTATGTVGVAFSYTITATNTPTSFGATGLPAGLSVDTNTGIISGTPTTSATTNITITATNAGGTDSKTLVLTVNPAVSLLGVVGLDGTANGDLPYYITTGGVTQMTSGQWPNPVVSGQSASQDAVFAKRSADSKMCSFIGSAYDAAGSYAAKSDTTYLAGWALIATDTSILKLEGTTMTATAGTYRYVGDSVQYKFTMTGGPPIPSAIAKSTDGGDTFVSVGGTVGGIAYSGGIYWFCAEGTLLAYGLTDVGGSSGQFRFSIDTGTTINSLTMPGTSQLTGGMVYQSANSTLCIVVSIWNGSGYNSDTVYTSPSGTVSWTSRQTFAATTNSTSADKGQMSQVGSYLYYPAKLVTGGWTMHRAPADITTFTAWAGSTAYTVGKARTNGGNIYVCTVAGTSAASGGPTGTGTSITDGSVTWKYHGPSTAMFQQVHQPGGTSAKPSKVRQLSDGNLYYVYNQQVYRSTDGGASFAAHGSAVSKLANQIAVV